MSPIITMAVPEFYRFFRPVLELLSDNVDRHNGAMLRELAPKMKLSSDDLAELLPSGVRTKAQDRTQWAIVYLRQAGLIEPPKRGSSRITERGQSFLSHAPAVIKPSDLTVFPEFVAFQTRGSSATKSSVSQDSFTGSSVQQITPEETIDVAFRLLDEKLAHDLIERIIAMPPAFFERLIVDLMLRMGYGGAFDDAGKVMGQSHDGGIDGIIKQDKLGLDSVYLQAKRWSTGTVGRQDIQAFVGALSGHGASKGVFITTSAFTAEAKEWARQNINFKLSLVDGVHLAKLMIEHNLAVTSVKQYSVKRVDSDYFGGDSDN